MDVINDGAAWERGRQAWERLYRRNMEGSIDSAESADPAVDALTSLIDIHLLYELLHEARLQAIFTARRHGIDWAEIAVPLGVDPQTAGEHWRDRADLAPKPESAEHADPDSYLPPRYGRARSGDAGPGLVFVPNVIGLTWDAAQEVLRRQGLVGTLEDPDGSLLAALGWPNTIVTDQVPESDARVTLGSSVKLWLARGGGSAGVREPRRPKPSPWSASEMRAEPLNE